MSKTLAFLLVLLVSAPIAVAAGNEPALPEGAPEVPETDISSPFADGLAATGAGLASAADATGDAALATFAFLGRTAAAIGHGIAAAASAIGHGIVAMLKGIGIAAAFVGDLIVGLFQFIGTALVAVASALGRVFVAVGRGIAVAASTIGVALAGLATALAGLFMRGAQAAVENPRETAVVAGSATSFAGILYALKRFGWLAGIPLYTRLAPGEILDNKARASVYEHIRANPGKHVSAIGDTLGLGWGTITYHLTRLEDAKLVTAKSYNNRKCYFIVGSELDKDARTAVAAMGSDPARRIVEAVRASPGLSQKELAATIGISQALASWHVKRLIGAGVLVSVRVGRSKTLTVSETADSADLVLAGSVASPVAVA